MKKSKIMKKPTLLLFGILFLTAPLYSQDTTIVQASKYEYCELIGLTKPISVKIWTSVDYGTHKKAIADLRIKDENGKPIKFVSMIAALNYLGDKGWELMQAYSFIPGGNLGGAQEYHWILKRPK